ncbi:MAG: hypothetical protein CM1200mP27_08850 [Chloroflexota bacterium]|nr:MAG: hypothetical protein CM1200mP27_08850 [Chloroflexota bacterium]
MSPINIPEKASRHANLGANPKVISGKIAAPPEEKPVMQIDMARERRRINHLFTALISTCPSPELFPTPTLQQYNYEET